MEYIGKGICVFQWLFLITILLTENNTKKAYSGKISDKAYKELEAMCKLCQENGVDLMVSEYRQKHRMIFAASWRRTINFAINHKITGICSKYGADYYDFNLVKPDLFSICPEYLSNFEHLNKTGSEVFCNAFSICIKP